MLTNDEFWCRVRALEGRTVYTLKRLEPNKIAAVNKRNVLIEGKTPVPFDGEWGLYDNYRVLHRDGYLYISKGWGNASGRYVSMAIILEAVPDEAAKGCQRIIKKNLKYIWELVVKKSLLHGEFTLASGQKSNYYIDAKRTTLDPEGAYLVGREIFNHIKDMDIVAIGGPSIGADPIVTAVSIASYESGNPIPAFIVRESKKEHGTQQQIFGKALTRGDRVVMVDDVVTTGGSILKAMEAVEAVGCQVVKVMALLDRHQGGSQVFKERGYDFVALLHASPKGEITIEPPR